MSVINTMLKDLDEREVDPAYSDAVLREADIRRGEFSEPEGNKTALIVGIAAVFVVAAVVIGIYLIPSNEGAVVDHVAQTEKISTVDMAAADVAAIEDEVLFVKSSEGSRPDITAPVVAAKEHADAQIAQSGKAREPSAVTQSIPVKKALKKTSPVIAKKDVEVSRAPVLVSEPDVATNENEIVVSKRVREPSAEQKSQGAYIAAIKSYSNGNTAETMKRLKDALNYDASNVKAHRLLASIYLNEGRSDIASETVLRGLNYLPDDRDLLRLYLQAEVQQENYNEAIRIMEQRLLVTSPTDLAYLAGLYQKKNNHSHAVKLYSQALKLVPTESVWWMGQAISFEALNEYTAAKEAYHHAIASGKLSSQLSRYVVSRIDYVESQLAEKS